MTVQLSVNKSGRKFFSGVIDMLTLTAWITGLLGSVALLVVLVGMNSHLPHLALAALVAALVAFAAYRNNKLELSRRTLSPSKLASINAIYMTVLWAWGGVAIAATYLMLPELQAHNWWRSEWWQFVLGFGGAAILTGIFAYLLANDESEAGEETTLTRSSRYLVIGQLIAMVATILGLVIDGKMDFGWVDWSANNIFFSGAAGLAILSWIALNTQKVLAGS